MKLKFTKVLIFLFTTASLFAQTVTDYDGNTYNTVTIGTQVWMKENLKTSHYSNGESIPLVTDNTSWSAQSVGAYCYYNNDVATQTIYGNIYNYYVAIDSRNVCPAGWHVPQDYEWTTLSDYLGGATIAGGKMKEAGNTHWTGANTGATNESGFTFLPGGLRTSGYSNIGGAGFAWSTTEMGGLNAWYRWFSSTSAECYRNSASKTYGLSIRCISDIPASVESNTNDNKFYVYPNPATEAITISKNIIGKATICMYNFIGEKVLTEISEENNSTIDVSQFGKGVYFITITVNTEIVYKDKIVLQ